MTPYEDLAEQMLKGVRQQQERAAGLRRQLEEIAVTVTASREVVRVTAGAHGELRGLEFPAGAYKRMAPAELAEAILKTFGDARDQAAAQAREVLASGQDGAPGLAALLGGEGLTAAGLQLPREIEEYLRDGAPNHGAPNHGAPNHGAPNHGGGQRG